MEREGRKQKNKQLALGIVIFITTSLLLLIGTTTISQNQKDDKVTVLHFGMFAGSYWDVPTGNCYQVIDDAIQRFEESHSNVKIEYVSGILKDDYSEWLAEQVLLGKEPDVFMIPAGEFDMLASVGVLKDLDDFIKKDSSFHEDAYYSAAYNYGSIRQKQYALPYETVPTLMFVNKTLLEKEGIAMPDTNWTWQDFLDICRQVTKDTNGDGVTDQFGYYDYGWKNAVISNGISLFDDNGENTFFGDEKVEATVRFVKELTDVNQGFTVTSKEFDEGKVAFRPLDFSEYKTYKPYPWRIKKYSNFEWDCVTMPAGPSGKNQSEVSTLLIGVGSRTNYEELAWEFIKTLCYEEETQKQIFKDSQGLPVIREVVQSSEFQELLQMDAPGTSKRNMSVIDQVMEEAVATPNFRQYSSVMSEADREISRILNGEVSMDNGLLKLQREMNSLLKQ